jgi:metal-dependent hydrolase (beta-lactamase superfamily II)
MGFHLNGPVRRYSPGPDDLGALAPSVIVPAHCTGGGRSTYGRAVREAFVPNTVGTRFEP